VSLEPDDPRLFELFSDAVQTGLRYVALAETGKTRVGTHEKWPEIRWHENGLPHVTSGTSESPKNYADAINGLYSYFFGVLSGLDGETPLDFGKEAAFLALVDYAKTQPRLKDCLQYETHADFSTIRLRSIVAGLLDRYIHITKKVELDRNELLRIYRPIERYLFDETLPTVVVVPILFLKFEALKFDVSEFARVERLSDRLHLARGWHGPFGGSDNDLVESAATHALFISGHSLANQNSWALDDAIMDAGSYPVEMVDTFFAALRIATGCMTGYAQLLTLPIGWASGYTADLASLSGPTVKNYPPSFERGRWLDEVPTVGSADAAGLKEVFENLQYALETKRGGKVRLAMRRLNLSALRTTDEDGVIDAMIAMEALLSDDSQEITHKVAMRLAALYKIVEPVRSEQAFREMKRIYTFRSKIVHGGADLDKYRILDRGGASVAAVDAAVEHLRTAFAVLIKNPALLDPATIDSFLLTGRFGDDDL
jgi:hypothetical protein